MDMTPEILLYATRHALSGRQADITAAVCREIASHSGEMTPELKRQFREDIAWFMLSHRGEEYDAWDRAMGALAP